MIRRFRVLVQRHQKYLPVVFFSCGFLWDTLTLGRIDRLYDRIILCTYLTSLSACLYIFNVSDDGKWKNTFLEKYEDYFPLAIQFFLGGLSSAYVIYFSRSVSYSKSITFFFLLIFLLIANEVLKKRISNKYLHFGAYFFVNFTFFIFFIPMLANSMNTLIFFLSGAVSLGTTLALFVYIFNSSPSTRKEIHLGKVLALIFGIYLAINSFYFLNLIPPVPLALDTGLIAHSVDKSGDTYIVTYEREPTYKFWRENREVFNYKPGSDVYVFTSIFAPTEFQKSVMHRWKWFSPHTEKWEIIDEIAFDITGGREKGFRGYTFKNNMMDGEWKVDVVTQQGQVLGIVSFLIQQDLQANPQRLITRIF